MLRPRLLALRRANNDVRQIVNLLSYDAGIRVRLPFRKPPMSTEIPFTFDKFGFDELLIQAIREAGFRQPSPIQDKVIPLILEGRDLVGQAHTGTGKTAA